MSVVRFAASGVLRNRRRTFSSILGVLLAITFIAGTFIAIDSSARATLEAILQNLQGDFDYNAASYAFVPGGSPAAPNGSVLRAAINGISGVTDASIYRYLYSQGSLTMYNPSVANNYSVYVNTLMAVDPYHLPVSIRDATVAGSSLLPNGTVLLDSATASSLQEKVGDPIRFVAQEYPYNGTPRNYTLTLTVGGIATLSQQNYGPIYYGPGPIYYYGQIVALNAGYVDWYTSRLNLSGSSNAQFQGEIWVDHDRFINPYDTQATTYQLTRLERQLNVAISAAGYIGSVNDHITTALSAYTAQLLIQRIQYLIVSVPVILLGLYLGAVGVDLSHAERRRELGVLKTRGASRGQIAGLLILESLLGGIVAAVLGLVFGVLLSRVLIGALTPSGTAAAYGTVSLTADTVIVVAVLSILFMLMAGYRSARRTASLPIIETLRYYAPGETRIHYSPALDIILVVLGVLIYVAYAFVLSGSGSIFVFLIFGLLVLALPAAPILLIIGLTRMLTRWTGRVYEWTSRLLRPVAKNLEYIIGRNLSRNPRRSSNIAIIIALGLAFGVFVTASLGSTQAMQEQSLHASVGADMQVTPPMTLNLTVTPGFGTNLSQVPGVARVTEAVQIQNVQMSPAVGYTYPSVWALNASSYFSVASPSPFFFEDPTSAAAAQSLLATTNTVLITGNLARDAALQVGDTLVLVVSTYFNNTQQFASASVTVGGIVRFLPGTYPGYFYGSATAPDAVYGSFVTFRDLLKADTNSGYFSSSSDRYLVALQPGADWKTVKEDIVGLGAPTVLVYQELLDQAASDPFTGSLLGFIRMEIAFVVVILTAGLGLIIYSASLERTVEFAGITARGSSGWQTAALLVGEAFAIMFIGVILGVAVGLTTGYLSTSVTTPSFMSGEPIVPSLFVFPLDGWLLVILGPVAMMGTTLVVAWRIAHMNVARVLKMRGG